MIPIVRRLALIVLALVAFALRAHRLAAQALWSDEDITLDTHHHPEFVAWRWVPMERLPELVIPFKRAVYERVVEAFRPLVTRQS